MISFSEFKKKSKRKNYESSRKLFFFSYFFSPYLSYLFVKFNIKADSVLFMFFLAGLIGAIFYLNFSALTVIIGYFLFRLHTILDVCDGEVARYNQTFNNKATYWDYMIHSFLYPLYTACIVLATYTVFNNIIILYTGIPLIILSSLMFVVNTNYEAGQYKNNILSKEDKNYFENKSTHKLWRDILIRIMSYESFLFLYTLFVVLNIRNDYFYIVLFGCYITSLFTIVLYKLINISLYESYLRRN